MLKTLGIVFRTIKYGETSVIADIFTEEKGLHAFIGSGVRSPKSRMPFNLFQPMSIVDMVCYYRDSPDALNRIKEMRAGAMLQSIPFEIKKGAIALFMAEVCQKSIHEHDENRPLFEYLQETILFLDTTMQPIANIHLHFLLGLTAFLGFQPDECFEEEAFFDLKEGVFLSAPPIHSAYLSPELCSKMLSLLRVPIAECHQIEMERSTRKQLLNLLLQYFQLHVAGFTEIKTPEVLEEVWH